jgi:hypothetical protein
MAGIGIQKMLEKNQMNRKQVEICWIDPAQLVPMRHQYIFYTNQYIC